MYGVLQLTYFDLTQNWEMILSIREKVWLILQKLKLSAIESGGLSPLFYFPQTLSPGEIFSIDERSIMTLRCGCCPTTVGIKSKRTYSNSLVSSLPPRVKKLEITESYTSCLLRFETHTSVLERWSFLIWYKSKTKSTCVGGRPPVRTEWKSYTGQRHDRVALVLGATQSLVGQDHGLHHVLSSFSQIPTTPPHVLDAYLPTKLRTIMHYICMACTAPPIPQLGLKIYCVDHMSVRPVAPANRSMNSTSTHTCAWGAPFRLTFNLNLVWDIKMWFLPP